ncbi:MAG TPA: DUF4845 domain-containing protein [Gammaproteobacteria bacterium]|nr:DUF4845 domain-containing protein [Gammaproteobacteria bacterium]
MRKQYQLGMTGLGWVIVLGLIGFTAMITIKMVPVVMEGITVKRHVDSLKNVPLITKMSRRQILALLQKRLDVDDVESVKRKNIKIERKRGRLIVTIEYEIRKPLLGRYDIVAKHKNIVDIISN